MKTENKALKKKLKKAIDTISHYELELSKMMEFFAERRTDVYEMANEIMLGHKIKERDCEHRYIQTSITIKGVSVGLFYDTLTTLIDIRVGDGQWKTVTSLIYSDESVNNTTSKLGIPVPLLRGFIRGNWRLLHEYLIKMGVK